MATEALFVAVVLAVAAIFIYAVLKMVHGREHPDRGRFGYETFSDTALYIGT